VPGQFEAQWDTTLPGVYRLRVRAHGTSRKGYPFTRERALTVAVWRGGDRDAENSAQPGGSIVGAINEQNERWCALLQCLMRADGLLSPELERRLRAAGFDTDDLRKCFQLYCRSRKTAGAAHGDA
jgi:hypothetical protein